MTWLKSEGAAPKNDKLWELSDAAYRLWDAGRHYAVEHLTDGHVPLSRISALTPKPATKAVIRELLKVRGRYPLWHELPDICESCRKQRVQCRAIPLPRTGYLVHDFLDYNPSRADWEDDQEQRRRLAVTGGQARAAQAARTGGRFASRGTSRTAGESSDSHQPSHQPAAGENAPAAPAAPPAPYPVLRTPVSGSIDPVSPRGYGLLKQSEVRRGGGMTLVAELVRDVEDDVWART